MFPVLFIAAFGAAAYGITRRLNRSGNPLATYSQQDRESINRLLASRRKDNNM